MIRYVICFLTVLLITGCMKDDDWVRSHLIQVDLPNGVFIVNEGNFWSGNSTLSFYDPLKKEVINNLFSDVNGYPLGDVGQSMGIYGNRGYIVANNSGKIWVIDVTTARYTEIISGLTSPRYVHFVNSKKAYITDLYAGEITIFNPGNNQKTGSILTKGHPSTEQMVQIGDLVFVTCWSYDNTILVIDSKKDSVTGEIKTAKQPGSIVVDKANKLWVLCDGGLGKTGKGIPVLQRINPESGNIELSLELTSDVNAKRLAINGTQDTLFFINKGIWKMPYTAQTLPDAPFIRSSQLLYGLGVDRRNSEVYFSNAIDYQQKGVVYRYSALGAKIDSFKTGITPGAFCFK